MNKRNTLRRMEGIGVYKNVSNPIMLLGYPIKLAFFHIGALVMAVLFGFGFNAIGANMIIIIGVPLVIGTVGITAVALFFNKYGVNGYELSQRNLNLFKDIQANDSILNEIKAKINANVKAK